VPDADFIVFVTAQATPECQPSTGAHAVHCVQDELNWYGIQNRPLAGYINFCPRDVSISTSASSMESLVDTAVHELIHTLFMSSDLFDSYITPAGADSPCATAFLPHLCAWQSPPICLCHLSRQRCMHTCHSLIHLALPPLITAAGQRIGGARQIFDGYHPQHVDLMNHRLLGRTRA
jgi:hypothetical protein